MTTSSLPAGIRPASALPLDIVGLDFETYYDNHYSLSKMTTAEYILDPRFRCHGCAIKYAKWDGMTHVTRLSMYVPPADLPLVFAALDLPRVAMLAQNTRFDAAILAWRYGIWPAFYLDTLGMGRSMLAPYIKGGRASLAAMAEYVGLPPKGGFISNMRGRILESLTPSEWEQYKAYGNNDNELTWGLWERLSPHFPMPELVLIDTVLRMYLEPKFVLDRALLAEHLSQVIAEKDALMERIGCIDRGQLLSNEQFAAMLLELGVEPPVKTSLATKKLTYAFAKSDPGLLELLEHEDNEVQALVAARIGIKSTQAETRARRLIAQADLRLPNGEILGLAVPLAYGRAHTGRLAGDDGLNLQNLPQRTTQGTALRRALRAPDGWSLVVSDQSQIEARLCAWLAGCTALTDAFRAGRDVYSEFASIVFGYQVDKKLHVPQRFLGKTAVLGLGYGMGAQKFELTVNRSAHLQGIDVHLKPGEGMPIVKTYRYQAYPQIPELWKEGEAMLDAIRSRVAFSIGPVEARPGGLMMPNGLLIHYPQLHMNTDGWSYVRGSRVERLFGGKVIENICQALSRIINMDAMLRLRARWSSDRAAPAITVHDDQGWIVRNECAQDFAHELDLEMKRTPVWGMDIPLGADTSAPSRTLGDAK